ncbi:selenocysteine-specific translation elongation factor [Tunturiibacter gelidoferens]|uniref:Selenocysteine-specific elongation factor n=1 Tax=Tunturiibacter gelidiferens TaxID=3069689 RepID=A0A9X0QFZ0_9BACT|nr:selenocysteine-specific translation elongation factor [Edaphobacter lichenicola]MBB5329703.1 selenocysteine-specific elongation factor [Edaphobacter lichenicola]
MKSAAARSVVLGTAGHIDHGKTALVHALTGTDTDRLPEEKSRGITIDLGFASLDLQDPAGHSIQLSLIDVPGHHAFIRNMLAGAGGIDCVMLVIAADEGIKPQTTEHLAICTLLGIRHGIVVITKQDAVAPERLEAAHQEVRRFVEHTFLEDAPVIAVSARTGAGIPTLKRALSQLALSVPARNADAILRLPLDRAFSVRGFGTVVTGTLQAGSLHVGDAVHLQPEDRSVRVRGIQVHGSQVSETHAPSRVALNLVGVEVAEVHRGHTIVPPETLSPVDTVDVELTVLPGMPALRHRTTLRLHAFTSETTARVLLYPPGENSAAPLARLRLSKPLLLTPGDRFVLRQPSPAITVGGGRVLDAHPLPRLRKAAANAWLEQLREAAPEQQILLRVRRRGLHGISITTLSRETGLHPDAIRPIIAPLIASKQLIGASMGHATVDHFLWPEALTEAVELLFKELERTEARSLSRAELRSRTKLEDWVFALAAVRLVQVKPVQTVGNQFTLRGAGGKEPTEALAKVEALYRTAGLASPIVSEVAATLQLPHEEVPPLITILIRAGKLVRMGADNLLIHAEALVRLRTELQKQRGQTFDVGRFKALTGLTRKHAIPLLEYLDGAQITRNQNGIRTVR